MHRVEDERPGAIPHQAGASAVTGSTMSLRTFCEDIAIDVRGCLGCAIVSSETGLPLATYVVPGSHINSMAMESLAEATVEYFRATTSPQREDATSGLGAPVNSIQIVTEDTYHLMSPVVVLDNALLTLVADRTANLPLAWLSVKRGLSRIKEVLTSPPRPRWRGCDFVDPDAGSATPTEDDPWDHPQHRAVLEAPPTDNGSYTPGHTAVNAHAEAEAVGKPADDDPTDHLLFEDVDDEPRTHVDDISFDDIVEFGSLNEPEPDLSATSVLRDDLYPPDKTIDNITLELKLADLFARLGLEDQAERQACRRLLKSYGTRRIRRLLPWLGTQQWPAGRLLLFLEFRSIWESSCNVRWWENWLYRFHPIFDYRILSWKATYELVCYRSRCRPTEVIDEAWFRDWEDFEIWHHGIMSFASFAVLRSQIAEGECWRHYVFQHDGRSHAEVVECRDTTYAPFSIISTIRLYRLSPVVEGDVTHNIGPRPLLLQPALQPARPEIEWADWEVELAHMNEWIDP